MSLGIFRVPPPVNEPVVEYRPGTPERAALKAELARLRGADTIAPIRIGGRRIETGRTATMVMPHDHRRTLGRYHLAGATEVEQAIASALSAKEHWSSTPFEQRAAIFLRAASLLRTRFRDRLNAATMLNQSKTAYQAEIDAACELIDFFSFNVHYLAQIMAEQPGSAPGVWNRLEYRPLDGFVFAVTPFNFTSIAANLPAAPALAGNVVLWKPAPTAMLSAHFVMDLFEEAGLPPGVINFLPGEGPDVGDPVLRSPELGGIHFTGSTATFQRLWKTVSERIEHYRQYPRLVGETGGKDFVLVHPSADPDEVFANLVRAAYEYQGQKCSAASRAYIPRSHWKTLRDRFAAVVDEIAMGDVMDFRNFMGAVIDARSFAKHKAAIDEAKGNVGGDIVEVLGGRCDDSVGYFVQPTVIVTKNPNYRTMVEELFGPVLTVYVYDDGDYDEALMLCERTSPYGLTGAIFARDRGAVLQAQEVLRHAAGNFYINDKPTGAVVGQQPFGGSRASGTNDKAGSLWNLTRWVSPRTIKENFAPATSWRYPFMDEQ